jgi:PhnB protein
MTGTMEEKWAALGADGDQGPHGGVTPHLSLSDGAAAVDFYKQAFGAEELMRMLADDGRRIMHGHLRINGASVMLADHFPEYCGGAPASAPAGVTLHLQVDDADAWFDRAVAAGAKPVMPLDDMFWGDRYGQVEDPFGHRWSIGSPIRKS